VSARPWDFHHGDGVDGLLTFGAVDHVITDPPYSQRVEDNNNANEVRDNAFNFEAMTDDLRNRAARAIALQVRRWALIFCDEEETYLWRFALEAAGMTYYRKGTWLRQGSAPQFNGQGPAQGTEAILLFHSRTLEQRWNGRGKHAVWEARIVHGRERIHPTQKPCALLNQLVEDFTDEGEIIADPFSGVATTGVSAAGLGRRFVGWELNATHHQNGLSRLKQPLLERIVEQQMLDGIEPKGSRARDRIDLDRKTLTAVEAAGPEGIGGSQLLELIGAEPRTLQRSLDRLRKNGVLIRQGRTNSTKYFSIKSSPPVKASEST
jgi:site-specific DNA-methyltransferase (adenine-specific)